LQKLSEESETTAKITLCEFRSKEIKVPPLSRWLDWWIMFKTNPGEVSEISL
jgi:hypothetical protein